MNSIESYEQKKRRLYGKVNYLPKYLQELSCLLQRNVLSSELLSIVDTDNFLQSTSHFSKQVPDYEINIKFSDRISLMKFVHRNISNWDASYMVSLSDSSFCGLIEISSLSCFNWNFNFDDERAGIITFIRVDGEEYFVLDYYEENLIFWLDVRIYKKHL